MGWLLVWATRKLQWLLHVEKMHVIFLPISLMYFSFLFYWHVFQASEFHWNLLGIWIAKFVWSNVDCLLLYKRKMLIPVGNYMFKVNNRNNRTKVWNMFKVNNKLWTYFINFEDVIAGWVVIVIYRFWAHNLDAQRKSVTKQTTDLKNDMYFTFLPFENWVRYG